MRRLLPPPLADLDDDGIRAAYGFPAGRSWVRGSMVSSLDGVMRGPDGTSRSIASQADARVFSILRSRADVVLVGAGTLRDEDYHPSRLPIAVVSGSLDLPMSLRLFRLRTDETPRTIVLTSEEAAVGAAPELEAIADLVPCGVAEVDLALAIEALVTRGLGRIHCEGGPRLLGDLAHAGLLDELLLSITPSLQGGGPGEHIMSVQGGLDPSLRLRTTQVLEEDGTVFIRASREHGEA
ncbi:MAG: dihydrofolate reductase family protein [Actinomycetota bacterium]|nr:dihydrofolate reductase family protein [Actinomycetota bacterium]